MGLRALQQPLMAAAILLLSLRCCSMQARQAAVARTAYLRQQNQYETLLVNIRSCQYHGVAFVRVAKHWSCDGVMIRAQGLLSELMGQDQQAKMAHTRGAGAPAYPFVGRTRGARTHTRTNPQAHCTPSYLISLLQWELLLLSAGSGTCCCCCLLFLCSASLTTRLCHRGREPPSFCL